MKILLIGPPIETIGGIQNYLRILSNQLKKKGANVNYFTQAFKKKDGFLFYFKFFIQFIKFFVKLKKIKPDIIQLNPSLIWISLIRDFIFLNISKINKGHVVFFIRGWRWEVIKKIKKNTILLNIFKLNISKADKIIVLSKDFKEELIGLGIETEKIKISTTMVKTELYTPNHKKFEPVLILFCSYMAKYKGTYEMLNSIPLILNRINKINFLIVGDGPELKNMKNEAKDLGIDNYINFTGFKIGENKIDLFKKSSIFIFTSYSEGFPNVVLEAMASGNVLVYTPVGALKNVMKNGKNGYEIKSMPPKPQDISCLVLKLINNPNLLKKMSDFNIKEAKEKYDVKNVSNEIYNLYLSIIKENYKNNLEN